MPRRLLVTLLITLASLGTRLPAALADAGADLAAGRTALVAGELDKALPLLVAAAESLPQSVEARLALADCYLQMGQVDDALSEYHAVIKLSPKHGRATMLVEALTARHQSLEQKLAAAEQLVSVKSYQTAINLLTTAFREPLDPVEREAVRLRLAEIHLVSGGNDAAMTEAVQLAAELSTAEGRAQANAIAALAAAGLGRFAEAEARAAKADAAPQVWRDRLRIIALLKDLDAQNDVVALSRATGKALATLPDSTQRETIKITIFDRLSKAARDRLGTGDGADALALVWPMVSDGDVPGDESVLKPIKLTGGWLEADASRQATWIAIADLLSQLGEVEMRGQVQSSPLAYWLASQVILQSAAPDAARVDAMLSLIGKLAGAGHASPDRTPGQPLSRADMVQHALILQVASHPSSGDQQERLVGAVINHIQRYEAAHDLRTGVDLFVKVAASDDPARPDVEVVVSLPKGDAHAKLVQHLAGAYHTLGHAAFNDARATLAPAPNAKLNRDDTVALVLLSELMSAYPRLPFAKAATELGGQIIERYADIEMWDAASRAIDLLYAGSEAASWNGRWQATALKTRHGSAEESKLSSLGRRLPEQLHPLIKEALSAQVALLRQSPTEAIRAQVLAAAQPLLERYLTLDRRDLADQVIDTLAAPPDDKGHENADLRDWALWKRASIAGQEAVASLARTAKATGDKPLSLDKGHQAEITILDDLVTTYPRSSFTPQVVSRISAIAQLYERYRSFDTAASVLAGFIKAHPKIEAAEQLEYALALISLKKARLAFGEREDKSTPPQQVSAEFTAAIKEISEFLKAHPTGKFTTQAEAELLSVAREYGKVGGWVAARSVIAQMTAAGPNANQRRLPGYARLLEAATYLGELDPAYGLHLLSPAPKSDDGRPDDGINALALANNPVVLSLADSLNEDQDFARRSNDKPASGPTDQPAAPARANPGVQFSSGGFADHLRPGEPGGGGRASESDLALAMVRRSEQQHLVQIARLGKKRQDLGQAGGEETEQQTAQEQPVRLPSGVVLSEAAMKAQDEAGDKAYAILLELVRAGGAENANDAARHVADAARTHIFWMFSFFEGQLRTDRAMAMIDQYLKDWPTEPDRVALAFRAVTDRVAFASHTTPSDRINLAWVEARHERFEQARAAITEFIAVRPDETNWVNQARMLAFDTYLREADLIAPAADARAAGLLMQASDELGRLLQTSPHHPECTNFPNRMWNIADRLTALGQREQAITILNRITVEFPTHQLARKAVLRTAQTYATDLASPLRAVETYQEYLSQAGDDGNTREQIFAIASQLSSKRRYVESLHVYGVFVDSFPTDPRAAAALQAIGAIHQANEAYDDAVASYERIIAEYPGTDVIPQVKLAIAECQINLSQWYKARRTYEEFVTNDPKNGSEGIAKARIEILKNLDRYQKLLDDKEVDRNKDDAQFQIGHIVLTQLQYTDKAIREFRKVVTNFPKSHQADDAQFEIGVALLHAGRLDDAREELLKVVSVYPDSPLADNALYMVGQSFEQQASRLSTVTVQVARAEAFERGQRFAYTQNQSNLELQKTQLEGIRRDLKGKGDTRQLGIEEAYANWRSNDFNGTNTVLLNRNAELQAEQESAMEVANRQDRINEAFREAVSKYTKAASDYPLGDKTSESLLRMAEIYEVHLKDMASAMKTYEKIVKFFPGTPVAEDAGWKVAQFHDREGQYTEAVQAYRDFIRNYPASKRVADAQFATAEALEQLGRWVEAMDAYQTFRDKFSEHAKAVQALEQINWIKAYRR